ncbi:hypothetical protein GCM10019017_25740 [Streptomyces showdoensis]
MRSNAQSVPDGGFGCPDVRDVSEGEDPYGPGKKARMDLKCVWDTVPGVGRGKPPHTGQN